VGSALRGVEKREPLGASGQYFDGVRVDRVFVQRGLAIQQNHVAVHERRRHAVTGAQLKVARKLASVEWKCSDVRQVMMQHARRRREGDFERLERPLVGLLSRRLVLLHLRATCVAGASVRALVRGDNLRCGD
jgi:hypothetical protein